MRNLPHRFFLGVILVAFLLLPSRMALAQSSGEKLFLSGPASAAPGQTITLTASTAYVTSGAGPFFNGTCALSIAGNGQSARLAIETAPPLLWKVTLPTSLAPGPYTLVCTSTNGASSNALQVNVILRPPEVTQWGTPVKTLVWATVNHRRVPLWITQWSGVIATVPFQVTVTQPYGYLGRIHFSADDPSADLPWDYTFTPADNGVHTFTATFSTSGPHTLTVADICSPPPAAPASPTSCVQNSGQDVGSQQIDVAAAPVPSPLAPTALNAGDAADGSAPLPLTVDNELDRSGNLICPQSGAIATQWLCLNFNVGIPETQMTLDSGLKQNVPELMVPSSSITFPVELSAASIFNQGPEQCFNGTVTGYEGVTTTQCESTDVKGDCAAQGYCQVISDNVEYDVTVEKWVPKSPIQGAGGGPPYTFGAISPFFGSDAGTWVPIDQAGHNFVSANLIQTQGSAPASQFPDIFVALHDVDTYLRVGVSYHFTPRSQGAAAPVPAQYPDSPSDQFLATMANSPGCTPSSTLENGTCILANCSVAAANQACIDWSGSLDGRNWFFGPPFLVHVTPTSILQLKALPYTIVYLPPGDKSTQTYTAGTLTQNAYGFSVSEQSGSKVGNDESTSTYLGGTAAVPFPFVSLKATFGDASKYTVANSQTNLLTQGQALTEFQSSMQSLPLGAYYPSGKVNPATFSYNQEMFWGDHIFLLLDPKVGIWNLSGCADNTAPPCAQVTPRIAQRILYADYSYGDAKVEDLYRCLAPGGSWDTPDNPEKNSPQIFFELGPSDCYELLKLDPFFMGLPDDAHGGTSGQATALPSMSCSDTQPPPGARFQCVTPYLEPGFGSDVNSGTPFDLSLQTINGLQVQNTASQTFTASTDVAESNCSQFAVSPQFGGSSDFPGTGQFKGTGLTYGSTDCNGSTSGSSFTITNGATASVTSENVTNVTGTLFSDDDDYACAFDTLANDSECGSWGVQPGVGAPAYTQIYFDGVYGTWAFQLPNAPLGPWAGSFPPPVVTSVTPQSNGTLMIKGSNLAWAVSVSFNGMATFVGPRSRQTVPYSYVAQVPLGQWSADGTSLTITPPSESDIWDTSLPGAAQLGPADVIVTTPSGSNLPNANDKYSFGYQHYGGPARELGLRPFISAVRPSQLPAAGGGLMVIVGRGFTGATAIKLGNVILHPGTSPPAPGRFIVLDDDRILATVPALRAGTISVSVETPRGPAVGNGADNVISVGRETTRIAHGFFLVRPMQVASCIGTSTTRPAVTSVAPGVGPARGNSVVAITGRGFCGATSVTVGGRKAINFTVTSDTEARAVLPGLPSDARIPDAGYVVDVAVCNSTGCSPQSLSGNFRYLAPLGAVQRSVCGAGSATPPAVTSVVPDAGSAGGNITVDVRGRGFCGVTSVTVGGRRALSFTVTSETEIRAVLPGLPPAVRIPPGGYDVDVAVCNSAGCSPQYLPGNFRYMPR